MTPSREGREAGRELDEEIKVTVMGLEQRECRELCCLRPYSTEIEPAFLVVEAMRAKGWKYRVGSGFVKAHFATFWRFAETGFFEAEGCHEGESLPLSICLSALAAITALTPEKAAVERVSPASL